MHVKYSLAMNLFQVPLTKSYGVAIESMMHSSIIIFFTIKTY